MDRLKTNYNGIDLYQAGLPDFPRNFTRDSIVSALILKDSKMLKNQLKFSALNQGRVKNPLTGEEPGKIHHEYPGVLWNGLNTQYNACDTTALFLIGHDYYQKWTGDLSLAESQKEEIKNAVEYIKNHLDNDYLFFEDPKLCGASRFALKVTYWKDSEILDREDGQPIYPVVYTLAHIQNLSGIRAAGRILGSKDLINLGEKMKAALNKLLDPSSNIFYLALDSKGPIKGISSDLLHELFYLDNKDLSIEQINAIENASLELETTIGYRTLSPKIIVKDVYHSETVWPFEQAIIHIGAKKFNLKKIQEVSSRILKVLDTDHEFFLLSKDNIKKSGCNPQLWTIAAKHYFDSIK
ncbi:MAG: hypothetical protein WC979_06385 [Candidatus Pacearchaeota archaeon]|jgi:glycogen debranching enzyme